MKKIFKLIPFFISSSLLASQDWIVNSDCQEDNLSDKVLQHVKERSLAAECAEELYNKQTYTDVTKSQKLSFDKAVIKKLYLGKQKELQNLYTIENSFMRQGEKHTVTIKMKFVPPHEDKQVNSWKINRDKYGSSLSGNQPAQINHSHQACGFVRVNDAVVVRNSRGNIVGQMGATGAC